IPSKVHFRKRFERKKPSLAKAEVLSARNPRQGTAQLIPSKFTFVSIVKSKNHSTKGTTIHLNFVSH
ncbi:MAG TPA: hypothetical protein PLC89_26410, partial [Haliscomenobacter sp.]|uniref:hypothetical protein n=1 Tax=Haliscomenobacter sp. TaxID=2717303 RepID=UPI002CA51539